jgi:plastocyanin
MRRLTVLAAMFVLAAGCGDGTTTASGSGSASGSASAPADPPEFGEADADTVVHVRATDYAFTFDTSDVKGPRVFFEVANEGEHDHEFEILDADGDAVTEIEAFPPADERTLAVELDPGTYTVQCILETDGRSHADMGMTSTLTVR